MSSRYPVEDSRRWRDRFWRLSVIAILALIIMLILSAGWYLLMDAVYQSWMPGGLFGRH